MNRTINLDRIGAKGKKSIRDFVNVNNVNQLIELTETMGIEIPLDKRIKKADKIKKIKENFAYSYWGGEYNNEVRNRQNERKKATIRITKDTKKPREFDAIKGFQARRYFVGVKDANELYQAIRHRVNKLVGGGIVSPSIILHFKSKQDGSIVQRTIAGDYLINVDEFLDRIQEVRQGSVEGSTAIPEEEFDLILNFFDLRSQAIGANSNSKKMLFNVVGIDGGKNGTCWKQVLEYLGIETEQVLNDFDVFRKFLEDRNLDHIKIIGNHISFDDNVFDLFNRNKLYKIETTEGKKVKRNNCIKPTLNDFKYPTLFRLTEEEPTHTLVYDAHLQHIDIIKDNCIEINEDIYFSMTGKIIKDQKIIFTASQLYDKSFERQTIKVNHYYLAFDLETIVDWDEYRVMKPYSLSIAIANDNDLTELNNIDKANDEAKLTKWRRDKVYSFVGWDCVEQLFNLLAKLHIKYRNKPNNIFTFMSFNGSNFDNFFLLDYLLKAKRPEFYIQNIFYNDNCLLKFTINGKDTFFDLRKHLVGSLKSNCDSFQVKICAKTTFDHHKAQNLYEEGKLIKYMTGNQELKKYNENDVLSLLVIFKRYQEALESIPATQELSKNMTNSFTTKTNKTYSTIGSLSMECFKENFKNLDYKHFQGEFTKKKKQNKQTEMKALHVLPKLTQDEYNNIQKYKCAGRVELFNGVQEINEPVVSIDKCSMYPYVMAVLDCYYPAGEKIETKQFKKDKIGFYRCSIDQSTLWTKSNYTQEDCPELHPIQLKHLNEGNLPNIYPKKEYEVSKRTGKELGLKENNYSSKEILEDYWISSVMIEQLQRYKCKVEIKEGFYFTHKIKGCDLFKHLLDFMKAKNNQDILKKKKDPKYNPALRETYKLLMNSISGKLIEDLHLSKTEMMDIYKLKEMENDDNIVKVEEINFIGEQAFITYTKKQECMMSKQRPIYMGVLIYDYSKCDMFNTAYSIMGKNECIYTDTDSLKVRKSRFMCDEVQEYYKNTQVRHHEEVELVDKRYINHSLFDSNSKVFGSYEDEFEDLQPDYFSCVQKKSWGAVNTKTNKYEISFKGVPKTNIIFDIDKSYSWLTKNVNKKGELQYEINNYKDVNNYIEENKQDSVANNVYSFFVNLNKTRCCYTLGTNFRRVVKQNVSVEDNVMNNKVQLQPYVKKISI